MRLAVTRVAPSLLLLSVLSACPPPVVECITGDEDVCDGGALPPDFCNTREEAVSDSANCHLTVTTGGAAVVPKAGMYISRMEDGGADQDYYFAQMPGTLNARSLLHVRGGYQVPQTAVNFSLNVLKDDGSGGVSSVATAIDRHGAAAPKPIDIVVPFGEPNARLFLLAQDEGNVIQPRVDNRNSYSLLIEVRDNPDPNEPNDTTATNIPLSAGGGGQQGMQSGFLATNNDVDLYSFNMTSSGRQIIYLRLTGPNPHPMNPPPPFRLSYVLKDPMGTPIAEDFMANEFLAVDMATARLAPMTGVYTLEVKGYRAPNDTMSVIKGDLNFQYQLAVQILPDLDTSEPNDTAATARAATISPNGNTSLTGKLSYVADLEWFVLTLPARGTPSTLRYTLNVANGGGRFPPLSGVPTRQIRIVRRVTTGAMPEDRRLNCRNNATLCPKGFDDLGQLQIGLVNALCDSQDPPLCLYSQRNEEPQFSNLKNMVGAIPVPAGGGEYLVMFTDEGRGSTKYADDRDWSLDLEWRDDADEASRSGPTAVTLSGATSVATGELTFGHGKILDPFDVNDGDGIRGPNDYDAYDTDKDLFQFNFGGATGDQSWEINWELMHPDGGSAPPGELSLELSFCTGSGAVPDGGVCAGEQRRIFTYNSDNLTPWYLPMSQSNASVLFSRNNNGMSTTVTALPHGCWCFSGARTATGSFFANVAALNRVSNAPLRYRISQRISAYPGSYSSPDGGGGCPVADAGCGFAR